MLAEGKNEAIPVMPFHELCEHLADGVEAVPSRLIIRSFETTLLSLSPDGSEDDEKGGKRLGPQSLNKFCSLEYR